MWLMFACTPPPAPALAVPANLVPVEHAESVPVGRFLGPTALGAANDLLCPWARGEPVSDASLARWFAEKRLVWRSAERGTAGADGASDPALREAARVWLEDANALGERCGTPPRRDVLVAAAADLRYDDVITAAASTSREGLHPWLLVADPSPDAAPVPARLGDAVTVVLGASGANAVLFTTGANAIVGDRDDPAVAAAIEASGCVLVTATADVPWGAALRLADDLRARQVPLRGFGLSVPSATAVALFSVPEGPTSPPPTASHASDVTVSLHGTLAAWRLPLVVRCAPSEATPCGCRPGTSSPMHDPAAR